MRRLLLVFHSQSGNTARLAAAAAAGAGAEPTVKVRVRRAAQAGLEDLLWAEALLLGTPENFGTMSGAVKDWFERTYYPAQGRIHLLPYAVFVSAGNDGTNAARQIDRIARGYPLRRVAEPLIVRGVPDEAGLSACADLGRTLAGGLALGIY